MRHKVLSLITITATVLTFQNQFAAAHQPVALLPIHKTADQGPILVDGTVSFALRANFTKANQQQGFRASLKAGELLNFEYLIIDKAPENKLPLSKLPTVRITAPDGKKTTIKFTERTKFYEPYGRTNYLFLSRYSESAIEGIYSFEIKSKAKAAITVATGKKEIYGEVFQPATCPTAMKKDIVEINHAQAAALVGMNKDSAIACLKTLSANYRIAQEDGEDFALTMDYRMDRVNLSINKNFVTKATIG